MPPLLGATWFRPGEMIFVVSLVVWLLIALLDSCSIHAYAYVISPPINNKSWKRSSPPTPLSRPSKGILSAKPSSLLEDDKQQLEQGASPDLIKEENESDEARRPPLSNATDLKEEEPDVLSEVSVSTSTGRSSSKPTTEEIIEREREDHYNPMASLVGTTSRRELLQQCALLVGGAAVVGTSFKQNQETFEKRELKSFIRLEPYPETAQKAEIVLKSSRQNITSIATNKTSFASRKNATQVPRKSNTTKKELNPVNFTQVAAENKINITSKDNVRIDETNFQKIQSPPDKIPRWLPKFLQPAPKVIKQIPDEEVLLAATIAGSSIEMVRTLLLYPLLVIKTRIQTRQQERQAMKRMRRFHSDSSLRIHPSSSSSGHHQNATTVATNITTADTKKNENIRIRRRLRVLALNIQRHAREGNLYAGLVPSLLVSVPATGIYYGARDITKRMLYMEPTLAMNEALITLLGALVADIASLMIRTPGDALAARLQAVAATRTSSGSSSGTNRLVSTPVQKVANTSEASTTSEIDSSPSFATISADGTVEEPNGAPEAPSITSRATSERLADAQDNSDAVTPNSQVSAQPTKKYSRLPYEVAKIPSSKSAVSQPTINSTLEDSEEALFREEKEHYKDKETTMLVNRSQTIEELAANVLPEFFEHEEEVLLQQLQRIELNTATEFERRPNLTPKQEQERNRKAKKSGREERNMRPDTEAGGFVAEEERPHSFTQEFLEDLRRNDSLASISDNSTEPELINITTVDWDVFQPIKIREESKLKVNATSNTTELASVEGPRKSIQKNGTSERITDEIELPSAGSDTEHTGGKVSLHYEHADPFSNVTANTTMAASVEKALDKEVDIRMVDDEEKELLKSLQEEKVYQEKWFIQSLERLPAIIITDLPYLLSRIAINRIAIHGKVTFGEYEVATIAIAMFCAFLTTPFDVVRTRLLVENEEGEGDFALLGNISSTTMDYEGNMVPGNLSAGVSPYPGEGRTYINQGVLKTMISIAKEGDGGIQNLYAGWLERTVYLGIGRAWLDPINIITYIGIRDTLLLRWFD